MTGAVGEKVGARLKLVNSSRRENLVKVGARLVGDGEVLVPG
jgi:hypothetical protein